MSGIMNVLNNTQREERQPGQRQAPLLLFHNNNNNNNLRNNNNGGQQQVEGGVASINNDMVVCELCKQRFKGNLVKDHFEACFKSCLPSLSVDKPDTEILEEVALFGKGNLPFLLVVKYLVEIHSVKELMVLCCVSKGWKTVAHNCRGMTARHEKLIDQLVKKIPKSISTCTCFSLPNRYRNGCEHGIKTAFKLQRAICRTQNYKKLEIDASDLCQKYHSFTITSLLQLDGTYPSVLQHVLVGDLASVIHNRTGLPLDQISIIFQSRGLVAECYHLNAPLITYLHNFDLEDGKVQLNIQILSRWWNCWHASLQQYEDIFSGRTRYMGRDGRMLRISLNDEGTILRRTRWAFEIKSERRENI